MAKKKKPARSRFIDSPKDGMALHGGGTPNPDADKLWKKIEDERKRFLETGESREF